MIGQLYTYAEATTGNEERVRTLAQLGCPVVWDSGAWSVASGRATINLDTHTSWVKERHAEYGAPHVRFIGLDVIGDPAATLANYRAQRAAGAPVEPTATYGATAADIDALIAVADTDWLNVGNLVGRDPKQTAAFLAFVRRRIPPEVKVHALGMTVPSIVTQVAPDGMDSSSWLTWAQFGRLSLFRPHLARWVTVRGDRADWHKVHRQARWLRAEYGIDPADLFEPTTLERTYHYLQVACRSMGMFAEWATQVGSRRVTSYIASDWGHPAGVDYVSTVYLVGAGNSDAGYEFTRDHYDLTTPPEPRQEHTA